MLSESATTNTSENHLMTTVRITMYLLLLVLVIFHSRGVSGQTSAGQTAVAAGDLEDAKITSRIESFKNLSPEAKEKISQDLQAESKTHYGFTAIKTVDDTLIVDVKKLDLQQKILMDQTTMHVVDGNLVPVAVLKDVIHPTGDQIYPDLQKLIASNANDKMLAVTRKVGRIRYWMRNGKPANALQESDAVLTGTGFVVAPGMIATACHVLDYFTDLKSGDMSPNVWVKIDFSAESKTHESYLITGVLGKGNLEGEDYAVLAVNTNSEDGTESLPDPVTFGTDSATNYVGVIGYPDLDGATKACAAGGTACDETSKWFSNFAEKNPGIIKIISPGRKTGNFAPLGFPIITYDSPTLGGQSGSPVIDYQSAQVIGIHYCCTGYKPDENEPDCAKLQPLSLGIKSSNEALAIKDVAIPK